MPSNDTYELQTLVDSLRLVIKAEDKEQYERDHYGGMNWGYHGYEFSRNSAEARVNFGRNLNEYIENRIADYLRQNYNMKSIQREEW